MSDELSLKTADDVARELISQPALFLEFDGVKGLEVPAEEQRQPVQRYTGKRSTQQEERMLKIGALRLLGASDREIEQACHVTRRTIPLILHELEKTGRITPLKNRLAAMCGDNAERANIVLRAALDRASDGCGDLELSALIKSAATAMGITAEKYLLLTGQATEIVEQRNGSAGREAFDAWLRENVTPIEATVTAATDSASAQEGTNTGENSTSGPTGDGPDTAPMPQDPTQDGAGGGPVDGQPGPTPMS